METNISQADTWEVISSYFDEHSLVQQQLDSYNKFIQVYIPRILRNIRTEPLRNDVKKCWYFIKYGNFYLKEPTFTELNRQEHQIFPDECRKRNLSYTAPS